jgi:hypothetical protein
MKPSRDFLERRRAARRAKAEQRRESLRRGATSGNMDRLQAEAAMATNDRHRAYGTIVGGG